MPELPGIHQEFTDAYPRIHGLARAFLGSGRKDIPRGAEWHDTTGRPYPVYMAEPIRRLRG